MVLLVIIRCSVGRDQIVQWAFIILIWAWLSDLDVLNSVKCSERCLLCIAIWLVAGGLIPDWLRFTSLRLSTDTEWWHFWFSTLFLSLRMRIICSNHLLKNLGSSFWLSFGVICKEKWFFDNRWFLLGLTYLKKIKLSFLSIRSIWFWAYQNDTTWYLPYICPKIHPKDQIFYHLDCFEYWSTCLELHSHQNQRLKPCFVSLLAPILVVEFVVLELVLVLESVLARLLPLVHYFQLLLNFALENVKCENVEPTHCGVNHEKRVHFDHIEGFIWEHFLILRPNLGQTRSNRPWIPYRFCSILDRVAVHLNPKNKSYRVFDIEIKMLTE